ncbi:MAG TPA: hypothetical protein PLE77_10080 [Kiritimatiellia bacterium]|nr:hypothetical protein [Kiritimatiellia bacterium]
MTAQTAATVQEAMSKHTRYLIRRKVFTLAGAKFHIYGPDEQLVFFSKMKAFKLREDIRLYAEEEMTTEAISIQARQIIDFSASYDVFDSFTGTKVGALRRKGMKSLIKDEWIIMDAQDREIGMIVEDSMLLALIRRFLIRIIPQDYVCTINNVPVCSFRQHFNPFIFKITMDFLPGEKGLLDRRLAFAAGVLLGAIEGRQD